jgi:beta-lactamase regulating signal transducer with metallopeptidase domain
VIAQPLTGSWIAYGLVVGVLLAAVAALAESALRAAGRPARWSWAIALGLTVGLVAIAPRRVEQPLLIPTAGSPAAPSTGASSAVPGWPERIVAVVGAAGHAVAAPVRWALATASHALPGSADRWLGVSWLVLSVALLIVFGGVYARFRRARARWPVAEVQGTRVRVAPDVGPAVVGLARPEIIVPAWLIERNAEEQRLVLVHEREHVAARDPLLLAAACVAAVVIPWHPAAWWMLSRLRLAVELDCDRRVLRHGVAPRSYGTLLIDLAGRCSGLRIGAPALADESSHLRQRLIAMTPRTSRFPIARSLAGAVFAAVVLLAACEAKLPTQTEVDGMTAASATSSAQKLHLMSSDTANAQYKVNGAVVSAADANAIPADRIASIQVIKGGVAPNGKTLVAITTRQPGDTATGLMMKRVQIDGAPGKLAESPDNLPRKHLQNFDGVILIDGVRSTEAAMQALAPGDILTVEVIKGPSAAALYAAPEAKNGVIQITTTKGAAKK